MVHLQEVERGGGAPFVGQQVELEKLPVGRTPWCEEHLPVGRTPWCEEHLQGEQDPLVRGAPGQRGA